MPIARRALLRASGAVLGGGFGKGGYGDATKTSNITTAD